MRDRRLADLCGARQVKGGNPSSLVDGVTGEWKRACLLGVVEAWHDSSAWSVKITVWSHVGVDYCGRFIAP